MVPVPHEETKAAKVQQTRYDVYGNNSYQSQIHIIKYNIHYFLLFLSQVCLNKNKTTITEVIILTNRKAAKATPLAGPVMSGWSDSATNPTKKRERYVTAPTW